MTACFRCKTGRLAPATQVDTMTLGGVAFSAEVPCQRCEACGETYTAGSDLTRFQQEVASVLRACQPSPDGFRFLRKQADLAAKELASLLDVTPETVSHWENGKNPIPRATWGLVGVLANEAARNEVTTACRLRAQNERGPREVRVTLPPAQPRPDPTPEDIAAAEAINAAHPALRGR